MPNSVQMQNWQPAALLLDGQMYQLLGSKLLKTKTDIIFRPRLRQPHTNPPMVVFTYVRPKDRYLAVLLIEVASHGGKS